MVVFAVAAAAVAVAVAVAAVAVAVAAVVAELVALHMTSIVRVSLGLIGSFSFVR